MGHTGEGALAGYIDMTNEHDGKNSAGDAAKPGQTAKKTRRVLTTSKKPYRRRGHEADRDRIVAWEEMIKLRIRGATLHEIAEAIGYYEGTVRQWYQLPEFQAKLEATRAAMFPKMENHVERRQRRALEREEKVEQLIDHLSVDAIRTINVKMRRSPDERIQLKAAIDLADRGTRTAKTKKVQNTNVHAILTPEILASMARTAAEINDFGHAIEPVEIETLAPIPHDDDEST